MTGVNLDIAEPVETVVSIVSNEFITPSHPPQAAAFDEAEFVRAASASVPADDPIEKKEPSRIHRVFKILFFVCILFLCAEIVWFFLITPMRPFSVISIVGIDFSIVDRSVILDKAGINEKTSYLTFDENAAEKNVALIPVVESVKIIKHFPGAVTIHLIPRRAVALFLGASVGKTEPAYFDRHGVVFQIGGDARRFRSLPVVSGLETGHIFEGSRLSSVYIPLFENLDMLALKAPELFEAISEIGINKKTYDSFDITLYPSHSPVRIRMNAGLDEETMRYMFLVLDVLEAKNERVSEIDFRAGTASYFIN